MGDILLARFGPLGQADALIVVSIVAVHVRPFMITVYHLLMAASSRITNHVSNHHLKLIP